jgi:hypothetical protein
MCNRTDQMLIDHQHQVATPRQQTFDARDKIGQDVAADSDLIGPFFKSNFQEDWI